MDKRTEDATVEPSKRRLESLTDGVFAIAMTLLVFGLHVQQFTGVVSTAQLSRALISQWPGLAAFALSFVVLGQFWVSVHNEFRHIRRTDHALTWLNIVYLLFISLVPFTADHLGRYGAREPVVVLYGLNLFALSAIQLAMWAHATSHRRLVDADTPHDVIRRNRRLGWFGVGSYSTAIVVGPFLPWLSVAIYVAIPLLNISGLAERWSAHAVPTDRRPGRTGRHQLDTRHV